MDAALTVAMAALWAGVVVVSVLLIALIILAFSLVFGVARAQRDRDRLPPGAVARTSIIPLFPSSLD